MKNPCGKTLRKSWKKKKKAEKLKKYSNTNDKYLQYAKGSYKSIKKEQANRKKF